MLLIAELAMTRKIFSLAGNSQVVCESSRISCYYDGVVVVGICDLDCSLNLQPNEPSFVLCSLSRNEEFV